jgi:flagellar protein FlaG
MNIMDIKPLGTGAQAGVVQTQSQPLPTQSSPAAVAEQQNGATSAVPQTQQTEPSADQVKQAVQKINASLASTQPQNSIEFSIDDSSHRIVVKVVDQSNNQVISQIPSKEALAIADSLDQNQEGQSSQGLLINQQA